MRLIINDMELNANCLKQFGVELLETKEMTCRLYEWAGWSNLSADTTRVIFPGNGAADVRRALGGEWLSGWMVDSISASRFWWPGVSPGAVVGLALEGFDFQTKDVVIIDDVISSGITIQKVRERHEPWMPKARWHALAWVSQRNAKLSGFASVHSAAIVGTKSTKAHIYSLSTILADNDIAKSFAERNFFTADCVRFLEMIQEMRR